MFPDIDAKDRFAFAAGDSLAHDRVVLIGGGNDLELAVVDDQPGPAAAETTDPRGFELFLEGVEAAERRIDGLGERASRRAAGLRGQKFPEHRVVQVAPA